MAGAPRVLEVEPAAAGRRLDVFLAERLGLSRAQVRRLLARGAVAIGGRTASERDKGVALAAGAALAVAPFDPPGSEPVEPEPAAPLAILASGPGWVAVDKPAGMPVHPLAPDESGTVLGALAARHPELQGVGEGGLRSGVVHRLDVATSGVLLFATREDTWQRLRAAFAERRVRKVYRALVGGDPGRGEVELALVTARHRPARVRVLRPGERTRGARAARTSWRTRELLNGAALVEVRPEGGFLHQIRVTLAHLGHPVLGDPAYGPALAATAPRQMLHAASLHHEEIAAESPDPADFAACLERLRA